MASLNPKLKAFVKYSATNEIIPTVLAIRTRVPEGRGWVQVPMTKCCTECCGDTPIIGPVSTSPNVLKAYIKYDKRGIVVAGSTIVRYSKPDRRTQGDWVQIPYERCCEVTTTTTTTTTTTSTTTTTTTTIP